MKKGELKAETQRKRDLPYWMVLFQWELDLFDKRWFDTCEFYSEKGNEICRAE